MARTHGLLGLALLAGVSGCIIANNPSQGTTPGNGGGVDIFLEPSFGGPTVDCFAASVVTVTATFANGALTTADVPCNSTDGIAIEYDNVLLGTYTVTIEALSQSGSILFGGTGTFTVAASGGVQQFFSFDLPVYTGGPTDGGVTVDAGSSTDGGVIVPIHDGGTPDSGPAGGPVDAGTETDGGTSVTLEFSFGGTSQTPGLTCAQAGVTDVSVAIDSAAAITVPCRNSLLADTATIGVSPGTHTFDLSVTGEAELADGGFSSSAVLYHSTLTNVMVSAGGNLVQADLAGATAGGITLTWTFADVVDSGTATCAQAGVSIITYTLVGPDQQQIAQGQTPCANSDGSTSSITFDSATAYPLASGIYTVSSIAGEDANGNQIVAANGPQGNLAVPAGVVKKYTITLSPPQ